MSVQFSEGTASWVSPKKLSRPSPLSASTVEVSRESGILISRGNFSRSERFSDRIIGKGQYSPHGRKFYDKNSMYKLSSEEGKSCTQGVGERHKSELSSPPEVAPGSYDIVASVAQTRSPLDGSEYCTTTMKQKLPSMLAPKSTASPGPHAPYKVRKPLDHDCPRYPQSPILDRGSRHQFSEDTDQPGPGQYDVSQRQLAGGSKNFVKCTFGVSSRFPKAQGSCSPDKAQYYAHFKFPNSEDYLGMSRSCSLGFAQRTDFTNPFRGHRSAVSPVHYSPTKGYGAALKQSATDGFASRCTSPIFSNCRSMSTPSRRPKNNGSISATSLVSSQADPESPTCAARG